MKDIPGYEGLYATHPSGKIWAYPKNKTWHTGRFLKTWLIGNGYETVSLYKNKGNKKFLVHRLIAVTNIPNPSNLPEINHKDANRLNNKVSNLEWVSSKENKRHAIKRGLYKFSEYRRSRGEDHFRSKLTENDVKEIKKLITGKRGQYEKISKKFNVSPMTISLIDRGVTWKHVI